MRDKKPQEEPIPNLYLWVFSGREFDGGRGSLAVTIPTSTSTSTNPVYVHLLKSPTNTICRIYIPTPAHNPLSYTYTSSSLHVPISPIYTFPIPSTLSTIFTPTHFFTRVPNRSILHWGNRIGNRQGFVRGRRGCGSGCRRRRRRRALQHYSPHQLMLGFSSVQNTKQLLPGFTTRLVQILTLTL